MPSNSKEWRRKKLEKGICYTCGKNPHNPNRKECESCRKKRNKRQREDYHKGTKSTKTKKALSDKYQKLKKQGLCTKCGKKETIKNKTTCKLCSERVKIRYNELKDTVFEGYGGYSCKCCGETIKEFLTLDHINNDGAEHRRKIFGENGRRCGSGRTLYLWIIRNNFPPIFQVLCSNCNWGKRMNDGICPHESY